VASPAHRAFRAGLLYRAVVAVSAVARHLPLGLARAIGIALASVGWLVLRRDRRRALEQLALAFPDWTPRARLTIARRMFHHLGRTLMEVLWLPNLDSATRDRTTAVEGLERARTLVREGRGMVAYTGHCGNWEWLACCVASYGLPLTVLQRERNESEVNDFITDLRARFGIMTIDRGSTAAAREMLRSLKRPGFLAFLIDQNIRAESAKVPFFGRPTLTPIGPARLAIRAEAPVVGIFIERRDDGTFLICFDAPIETTRDDDPIALTARMTARIEAQIRRNPEQWVWMHERWRERPQWEVLVR
jgi:Kdo2-lipid IVA lauroyltransferase/acyltransferase